MLEILVVLVIAGLLLGLVAFNAMPDERQALQTEAQRIALLLQLARDEAIVRNRPIAFEAEPERYRFLHREGNRWEKLPPDDLLREREFPRAPLSVTVSPAMSPGAGPLRLIFGREPVDRPFVLTLSGRNASVSVRADGIGNFTVE